MIAGGRGMGERRWIYLLRTYQPAKIPSIYLDNDSKLNKQSRKKSESRIEKLASSSSFSWPSALLRYISYSGPLNLNLIGKAFCRAEVPSGLWGGRWGIIWWCGGFPYFIGPPRYIENSKVNRTIPSINVMFSFLFWHMREAYYYVWTVWTMEPLDIGHQHEGVAMHTAEPDSSCTAAWSKLTTMAIQ